MPTARRSRRIAAPADELWAVVSDPHHLPRWWPRVTRVEDVHEGAFTEVMKTKKGKTVRADFEVTRHDSDERSICWRQRLEGTPFAAVLASSETEVQVITLGPSEGSLEAAPPSTEVTIELRQEISGGRAVQSRPGLSFGRFNPSWGARLVRKAADATLDEALDGLERISV